MKYFIYGLKSYDWLLGGAFFLLVSIGLATLFSLSEISIYPFLKRQFIWFGIGLILMVVASGVDFRIFKTQSAAVLVFYLFTTFMLSLVLIANVTVHGASSWFKLGTVFFQPVELAKLSLIILLAKFFSRRHIEIYRLQHILVSAVYLAIPVSLVFLQPDLGSSIVLISIWFAMIVFSGMKLRHFFLFMLTVILLGVVSWNFILEPYQKDRVTAFIDPYKDPRGSGYQMIQSVIAVGSGGVWGKGIGYGSQSHLNFLPEAETDFIFAAFAEEWGFMGVLVLLSIFGIIIWRTVDIGRKSSDNFSRLYTLGFAAYLFVQGFLHIAMNMGVVPVTGITLPFVSYGGSSLVTLLVGVGILQNIRINSRREIE